jgi:hypothetical protein
VWPQTGTTTTNLNFRSGPSTTNSVLGVIPGGTAVQVTGPANAQGWYPVSYQGKTGWSKASYFKPLVPSTTPNPNPTPTPTPTPTPSSPSAPTGGGAGGMGNASSGAGSPFYNPTSAYGAPKSLFDTPLIKDKNDFDAERTAWAAKQGFNNISGRSQAAEQQLFPKLQQGYSAAKLNNPGLTNRDYFAGLGGNFISNALRRMTPSQRNESYSTKNPLVRSTPR